MSKLNGPPTVLAKLRTGVSGLPVWQFWLICFAMFFAIGATIRVILKMKPWLPPFGDVAIYALTAAGLCIFQWLGQKKS